MVFGCKLQKKIGTLSARVNFFATLKNNILHGQLVFLLKSRFCIHTAQIMDGVQNLRLPLLRRFLPSSDIVMKQGRVYAYYLRELCDVYLLMGKEECLHRGGNGLFVSIFSRAAIKKSIDDTEKCLLLIPVQGSPSELRSSVNRALSALYIEA